MSFIRHLLILFLSAFLSATLVAQEGFTDQTRALYILDISRYVEFDDSYQFNQQFIISILDQDLDLYWELERLSKTRKSIQEKSIRILVCSKINQLQRSNVVFVNSGDGYEINEVLKKIKGSNTLLISEGYPFKTSMINFVVIDGLPKFEANEELMKQEGLFANELFLAQAIKTREDWEALYEVTEDELEIEKNITEQQYLLIEKQLEEIRNQEALIGENNSVLQKLRTEVQNFEKEIKNKLIVQAQQEEEIRNQKDLIRYQTKTIDDQLKEVRDQRDILVDQEKNIRNKENTLALKEEEMRALDEKIVVQAEAIQKQKIIIIATAIALMLAFGLGYFIWRNYRNKKRANVLLQAQRDQIAYQKKHITDSIEYAKRIQAAILPSMELFSEKIEHFVLFKPRDIVSGDFYWVEQIEDKLLIIAADCTGHGVPGAFMSMLGVSFLNEIVLTNRILRPDKILNTLRLKVIDALKQEKDSILKDGMDMTVCLLHMNENKLLYSGANNPLYIISKGELKQVKGDKMPVAIHEVMDPFALHEFKLIKGDTFYTFSDGFADQFGGPLQKKFLSRNFRALLLSIQELSMIDQGKSLDETFEDYRKEIEQVDDVVVIGVRC